MLTGIDVTVILSDFVAVCAAGVVESVACTVKAELPEPVGVPEIVPVEAFKPRPTGSDPELIDQV